MYNRLDWFLPNSCHDPAVLVIQVLDYNKQIGLLIYLIYQWKAFLRWNRKNARIPAFEKRVYEEVFAPEDTE